MSTNRSGKDIVERLYRAISRAEDDLEKLASGDVEWKCCNAARLTLQVMRQTNRLLVDLIGEMPAPQRPGRKTKPAPPAEP
jgi:ketosteroid isomerase-like protein